MPKRIFSIAILLCFALQFTSAQTANSKLQTVNSKPKLVVGLVIDQMRWDYLYRYNSLYSNNGFKRLLKEGFSCENTMIPYTPTYTAPGHTCVYTGSVPAIHGIVSNSWYNRLDGKYVYCTDDSTVNTVGSNTKAGKMSPENMWATSITDELRLSNNFKSKVIGIALKDRGAILPAGHSANAAYWYDDRVGKWITSTHYMNSLPLWVAMFNDKGYPEKYMNMEWKTLLPEFKYTASTIDNKPYEKAIKGEETVTFPHKLYTITKDKFEAFKTTPFASTFTFDFAKAAIENESLGKNTVPDFLAISISSTDYIGHSFGPNSMEAEDAYLRLDKDIADFLLYLDTEVGKGNYLFFLTADHGAAHVPAFLNEHNINGAGIDDSIIQENLNKKIEVKLGFKKAIDHVSSYQVYLNDSVKHNEEVKELIIEELKKEPYIQTAVDLDELSEATLPAIQKERIANSYTPSRSGDIQFIFKPGYFDGGDKGTTHGLWNPYDSHIPLLFYGWGIKKGNLNRETYMTDIAATVAAILQIQMPSGCVGHVIREVMK
jgi:predicted AlkP superfamily pyrophosphatase or phosphodiesterase